MGTSVSPCAAAAAYRDKIKCEANGQEWKQPKGLKSSKGAGGRDEPTKPSTSTSSSRSEPEKVKKVKAPKMSRGRGLHSSTFRLNVSDFCGTGGAFEGCSGGVYGVLGGIGGCIGCIMCQKRLKLSGEVDECKPLARGFDLDTGAGSLITSNYKLAGAYTRSH